MDRNRGICFLLAAFLLLGLCACGGKPQPAPSPSGASTSPPVTASPGPAEIPKPTVEEMRAAYDAAVEAFGWFEVGMYPLSVDRTDVRETEVGRYYLITDSRFDTWDTLEEYLYSLFDGETVLRLLSSEHLRDFDGRLYGLAGGAGTDPTVGELTGFQVKTETEDRFVLSVSYERPDVGVSVYEFSYVWQGDRWVFEDFHLVYANGGPLPELTPEPPFVFTRKNFPRLNGSTSTVPLAEAVCSALLGESREDVGDLIHFSKTTQAYRELLSGNADLLIIGEANVDILAEKEAKGFEWLKTPFATDAFVFVVNEKNPVDSITVEEARKIYTGEITNWSQLGGRDEPIIPFQRNAEAGSQTLMEKHVMQGTPMMEAPEDYIVATMGGLMAAVKSYDNSAGAIGYSVYYYAEEMKAAQGLKLLKLEGVEPNPDTIRSEEYPIVNPKYVVISAKAAEDSPTKQLYDWLLSEEGQELIAAEGYVSVMDFDTAPRESDIEPVGVFWEGSWEGLTPLAEPERVTAYAGQRLSDTWPSQTGCLYGLMTASGEAVTPPVFSEIQRPKWWSSYSIGSWELSPLVLRQGSGERGAWGQLQSVYILAARDLSWVWPGTWLHVIPGPDFLLLLGEDHMEKVSEEGELLKSWDYASWGLTEYMAGLLPEMNDGYYDSVKGRVVGDMLGVGYMEGGPETGYVLFDMESGEVVSRTRKEMDGMIARDTGEGNLWNVTETETGSRFTRGKETLELPVPCAGKYADLWGDLVVFFPDGQTYDRDGREVRPSAEEGIWHGSLMEGGQLLMFQLRRENNTSTIWFLRPDGSALDVTVERGSSEYTGSITVDEGVLGIVERDRASYYRIDSGECIFRISLYYEKD